MKEPFAKEDNRQYRLTFAGCLAVHLMGIGYHGRKLHGAIKRLTSPTGIDQAPPMELQALEEAVKVWRERIK